MSVLLAAALAGASAAALVALPEAGRLRFDDLRLSRAGAPAGQTGAPAGRSGVPAGWLGAPALLPVVGGAAAVLLLAGPVPAALLLVGAGASWRWWSVRAHRGAAAEERAGAVEAFGALAAELRAGRPPAEALAAASRVAVGPLREVLRAAAASTGLGGNVAAALRSPPTGAPTAVPEVLRALAACWTVCATSGSGLAAAVDRLAEGLRAEHAQRRAVDAELSGPRATAGLLAVLPLGGLLMAGGLGADPLQVLLHTPLGLVCLTAGLALEGCGLWWTHRLVARAGGSG
ncbi:MAG: type II secretion system F family protein [Mycobacteriales bacterium]